jgi:hypothetical protein
MKLLSLEQVSAAFAGNNEETTMMGMEDKGGEQERLYYKGLMLEVDNNNAVELESKDKGVEEGNGPS